MLGLSVVLCICFGLTLNALGILTVPILAAFRCSHEEVAGVATAFLLAMTLAMPAAGWLIDRVPARPVMVGGALAAALGYLLAAGCEGLTGFIAALALGGAGIGLCTYVPAVTLVSRWIPPNKQGLAFGILLAAVALGGMIFPLLLNQAIAAFGWRVALRLAAAVILGCCVPLLFWLARMPAAPASDTAGHGMEAGGTGIGAALRSGGFWLWTAMLLLITLSSLAVLMALVPYLVSIGYSSTQAASANAGTAAATLVGNLLFGALSNRFGAERTLMFGSLASAAGTLFLLAAGDPALGTAAVVAFVVVWGTTFNLANQLSPTLLLEAMGPANFGSLLGIGNLLAGLASAFGPQGVGYLVDATHAYTWPLLACAALMAAALLPLGLLHRARSAPATTLAASCP